MLIPKLLKWAQKVIQILNFAGFALFVLSLAYRFLEPFYGPFQRVWDQHKIIRFLKPHSTFDEEKNLGSL
jgi:hypothetical protein